MEMNRITDIQRPRVHESRTELLEARNRMELTGLTNEKNTLILYFLTVWFRLSDPYSILGLENHVEF